MNPKLGLFPKELFACVALETIVASQCGVAAPGVGVVVEAGIAAAAADIAAPDFVVVAAAADIAAPDTVVDDDVDVVVVVVVVAAAVVVVDDGGGGAAVAVAILLVLHDNCILALFQTDWNSLCMDRMHQFRSLQNVVHHARLPF